MSSFARLSIIWLSVAGTGRATHDDEVWNDTWNDSWNELWDSSECDNGSWSMRPGSDCEIHSYIYNDTYCVKTRNFPYAYENYDQCEFKVDGCLAVTFPTFATEYGWDYLIIDGYYFSGRDLQSQSITITDTVVRWTADVIIPDMGFEMCFTTPASTWEGDGPIWDNETTTEMMTTTTTPCGAGSVTSNCEMHADGCYSSDNHPDRYSHGESCYIRVNGCLDMEVVAFHTESGYDYLNIDGETYSGSGQGPWPQRLNDATIEWSTDGSAAHSGWQICFPDLRCGNDGFMTTTCARTADGCVTSGNYPGNYNNYDSCLIEITGCLFMLVEEFETESYYDRLTVLGTRYTGSRGPESGPVRDGTISWYADGSVTRSGWKLCFPGAKSAPPVGGQCRKIPVSKLEGIPRAVTCGSS